MGLIIACRAFIKALKEPSKAVEFLEEKPKELEVSDLGHLRLLAILQQSGRLVDFFKEDITNFSDDHKNTLHTFVGLRTFEIFKFPVRGSIGYCIWC